MLLVFCLFGLSRAQQQPAADEDGSPEARVTMADGEVTVFYRDRGEEGVPAEAGMPLEAGDRVRTGADSRAEVGLDGESVIELGPHAEFAVTQMDRKESVFSLNLGLLLAKIRALAESGRRLEVRTPTAVASVRGTEFGVELGEGGETHVGVFDEGQVAVRPSGGGGEALLSADQEITAGKAWDPARVRPLTRFARHLARIRNIRQRSVALRRTWRRLPPARRQELRRQIFDRRRDLMRRIRERRRQLKKEGGGPGPRSRRRSRPQDKKRP